MLQFGNPAIGNLVASCTLHETNCHCHALSQCSTALSSSESIPQSTCTGISIARVRGSQTLSCPCSALPSLSITLCAVGATTVAQAPEARPFSPRIGLSPLILGAATYASTRGRASGLSQRSTDHQAGPRIKRLEQWGRQGPGLCDLQRRQRLRIRCYVLYIVCDIVCIHRMHKSPVSGDMRLRNRI